MTVSGLSKVGAIVMSEVEIIPTQSAFWQDVDICAKYFKKFMDFFALIVRGCGVQNVSLKQIFFAYILEPFIRARIDF